MKKQKKKFFTVFRIASIFLLGLLVAIIIAFCRVNLETLRGNVIKMIQDATNTPVEVAGAVSWKFSLRPQIELNDVRVPNYDWAKCKYALTAKKIDVRLNLISLFHSSPTIQNIRVYGANACIERNSDGVLSVKRISQNDSETNQESRSETPDKYLFSDPGFGGLEIKKLTAKIFGESYSLAGFQIRHASHTDANEYSGWIKFNTDVFPFIFSYSEYDAERNVYPIRLAVSMGGDALIADLFVHNTDTPIVDFNASGDVSDITTLGRVFGVDMPTMQKISINLNGTLSRDRVVFNKSVINARGTELNFSCNYNWAKNKIKLQLNAQKITLYELLPELFVPSGPVQNRELNVFHDMPLYGDVLRNMNVDVDAQIKRLVMYRNLRLDNTNLKLKLSDAHGRLDLRSGIADGDIRIAADIDIDADGVLHIVAGGVGQRITVGTILSQINIRDFISGLPVNLEFYLRGSGRDIRELMHTVNGPVQMFSVDSGYAHSQLVANIYGTDFLTSLRHGIQDLFRSEKKHNQMKISCVAVNTKLRDGFLDTDNGIAAETAAINVGLSGDLDLGAEKINMALNTVPVRGIKLSLTGNVVNSISISGNLAEPDVKISGAAVAGKVASATGFGLLLAPLTGGLGLVAGAGVGLLAGDLLENWLADGKPCETAMRRGAPHRRHDPEWFDTPIEELIGAIFNPETNEVKE